MAEETFSGNTRGVLDVFHGRREGEFLRLGSEIIESEEMSDLVYKTYVALLTDGWRGNSTSRFEIDDVGEAYVHGFYVPCTERYVLAGQIDLVNDSLPHHAGLVAYNNEKSLKPLFISCRKVSLLPRGVLCPPFAVGKYSCTWFYEDENADRKDRRIFKGAFMRANTIYFAIMPGGTIAPCQESSRIYHGRVALLFAAAGHTLAAAINATADRRHVWNVATGEPLSDISHKTPLVLGVSKEHIKSLFYARSLPITETGRKRPILHWVTAHQRRLKEGLEIDIDRHLRGISSFEMEGFSFEITSPRKAGKKAA